MNTPMIFKRLSRPRRPSTLTLDKVIDEPFFASGLDPLRKLGYQL
jgi:hypothetical protein